MVTFFYAMVFSLATNASIPAKITEQIDNSQISIEQRWQSMMSLIAEYKSNQEQVSALVDKSLQSSDWLLRSSALQVLKVIDSSKAQIKAKQALNDSAMMVRITAASVLKDLKDKDSVELLKKALNEKINFNNGQSLPSRLAIVKALFDLSEDPIFWQNLENDKDPVVQELARYKSKKITETIR